MVSRRGGAKGKKKADTSDQPQESHQDENQDAVLQQAESQGENPQGSEVSSDQLVGGRCRRVLPGLAQEDAWGSQDTQQDDHHAPEKLVQEEEKLRNEREGNVQALKVGLAMRLTSSLLITSSHYQQCCFCH